MDNSLWKWLVEGQLKWILDRGQHDCKMWRRKAFENWLMKYFSWVQLNCLGVNTRLGLTHSHTAAIKIALPYSPSDKNSSHSSMVWLQRIALPVVAAPCQLQNHLMLQNAVKDCGSSCDIPLTDPRDSMIHLVTSSTWRMPFPSSSSHLQSVLHFRLP